MRIETIERWNEIAPRMAAAGYSLWQMQYDVTLPEGFHAWFYSHGRPNFEVMTHSKEIKNAIMKYGESNR